MEPVPGARVSVRRQRSPDKSSNACRSALAAWLKTIAPEVMADGVTVIEVSEEEFAEEARRVQAAAEEEEEEEEEEAPPPPTSGFTPFSGTGHRLPPR